MIPDLKFYPPEQLDRLISKRFSAALMNDSKWERLIDQLTNAFEEDIHVNFKLIHSDAVHQTILTGSDFKPFFIEPTLYREIEWLEFPRSYEGFVNPNNQKSGRKTYDQDVFAIEREIVRIGQFELERLPAGLRIHAYK